MELTLSGNADFRNEAPGGPMLKHVVAGAVGQE
jgi:hypothetical protein